MRLLREVAAGPRSVVYVGDLDRGTARTLVAVKLLSRRFRRDAEVLFRLRDVGRELASLDQHTIVAPVEVVVAAGRLGLVGPYVDGIDLFDLCEVLWDTGRGLPTRVLCGLLAEVAGALDAADTGLGPDGRPLRRAHRDLRPGNIMIDRDGRVRVLDLGTGLTAVSGRRARGEALKKGLTRYLSPERREGKRGGAPADVYALGIIGIEASRGGWLRRLRARNPDHDRQLADVVARITDLDFRSEGDELALRNLLLRMVAHDPDARPKAAEVADQCRHLATVATGPDVVAFAAGSVVPWLEAVPEHPDPDLPAPWARIVDTPAEVPPAPESDDEEEDLEGHWVETADGWRAADDPAGQETDVLLIPDASGTAAPDTSWRDGGGDVSYFEEVPPQALRAAIRSAIGSETPAASPKADVDGPRATRAAAIGAAVPRPPTDDEEVTDWIVAEGGTPARGSHGATRGYGGPLLVAAAAVLALVGLVVVGAVAWWWFA